ncbi:hypothetical protein AO716_16440 [Arthrobacter sp. Edens01]|nr:hypothetical protein AO716_16440 [Arthrobacter sp. Edens01]
MRLPAIRQSAFGELDSDTGWTLVEAFAAVHRWQSHHVGSFDQCFWLQHFGGPSVCQSRTTLMACRLHAAGLRGFT